MMWTSSSFESTEDKIEDNNVLGERIEVEGLEKYVVRIEKKEEGNKLSVTIEDSINRLSSEFGRPHSKSNDGEIRLEAEPLQGFMMKGPELRMSLMHQGEESLVTINITKGRKPVFADDMRITNRDYNKLARYIKQNFATVT